MSTPLIAPTQREQARGKFAVNILERYATAVRAASNALREVERLRPAAEMAMQAAKDLTSTLAAREADFVAARLAADTDTDEQKGDGASAVSDTEEERRG